MKSKSYWITERHNPQLGIYYIAEGQLTKKEAKGYERAIYGSNVMHRYDTEEAYKARLAGLRASGEHVQ